MRADMAGSIPVTREHSMKPRATNPRVLLVEDDPTSRSFLAGALDALPVHTDTAADCAQARDLARQHDYVLWLIDANLPDGNGADLLADLRRHASHCLAVAHTAAREASCHDTLRRAGFAEVLVKPLPAAAVQDAVRRLLDLPASEATAGGSSADGTPASVSNVPQAPPSDNAATPVWDDDAALAALHGQAAHVDALRKLFRDELPAMQAAVHDAVSADDAQALREVLHRLDASCGFVGARQLAVAVKDLRLAANPGALARFDDAAAAVLA